MRGDISDNDFELRPVDPEDSCDYCEALDTEPHQEDCPLFLPLCRCGAAARRYLDGEPFCSTCKPVVVARERMYAKGAA